MLSESTIAFFEKLLDMCTVKANDPMFDVTVATISTAKRELAEARAKLLEV